MILLREIKIIERKLQNYPKLYKLAKRMLAMVYHDRLYDFQGLRDDFATTPRVLYFRNYGKENADIPIYYITFGVYNEETCGFWGMVNTTLRNLVFADFFHLTPVVEWQGVEYGENFPVHGSSNAWEYYFEPVSQIDYRTVKNSAYVCPALFSDTQISNDKENESANTLIGTIKPLVDVYRKYIRLNKELEKELTVDMQSVFQGKRTMGCHARGSDGNWGLYGHPIPVLPQEYLDAAYECFIQGEYEQIFLATEDPILLNQFIDKFGDSLVYYKDVLRSSESHTALARAGKTDWYHYRMGYEVVRDAYTLAECDSLVAGTHNVPLAARIIKCAQDKKYKICNIIDHGIGYEKNFYRNSYRKTDSKNMDH